MLKLTLTILIGKAIKTICRLIPGFGGTALPGLIALKLNKDLVKDLVKKNHLKSIIITGTNGKTTTSRLLAHILKTANIPYLQNRTGSNLKRGIASSLISDSSISGKLPNQLAIFEVDEAAVFSLSKLLNPKIILFTNLFRDQLDRYGEIDTILSKWQQALKNLKHKTTIIYNCDDPSLEYLVKKIKNKISFGLDKKVSKTKSLSASADATFCPNCHQPLNFAHIFTSHLGHYSCSSCKFKRPTPDFCQKINSNLIGIHNFYNLLAATSLAKTLKISQKIITKAIKSFSPAFGRGETFKLKNLKTKILLVKNP
ncbi:MAG: Mur ligase family protein, partial [Patescibacteria group bacterium]|nr:Mur ligase family protein [Patescibacteria group bacterium]